MIVDFEKVIETIIYLLTTYSMKFVAAIIIFIIGKWIAGKISRLVTTLLGKSNVDVTLVTFFEKIIYYTLLVVVIIAVAGQLGINTTSFITIVGAAGLAIGLALKDSLSNLASGVMLILFRPFGMADFVEIGGVKGTVSSIGLFNTTMNTVDNKRVIVPNAKITGDVITNVTANKTRRVDLVIGIGYDDDIRKAKDILTRVVSENKNVLDNPKTNIAVLELADSSVNFVVRPWVKTDDYWNTYFQLTEDIKLALDAEGITIPYPQRDIHVYKAQS